jgi:type IV pilus assembly protein PilB
VISHIPTRDVLVQAGLIDTHQLQSASAYQRQWGCSLERAVVALGFVSERVMMREIARRHGIEFIELGDRYVGPEIVRLVPEKLIRSRKVFPIGLGSQSRRGPLTLATSEPGNLSVLDEVAFATGKAVTPVLASEGDIEQAIKRHLGTQAAADAPRPPPLPGRKTHAT